MNANENWCAVCGWSLAIGPEEDIGCARGDCSRRPLPQYFADPDRAIAEGYDPELVERHRRPPPPPCPECARLTKERDAALAERDEARHFRDECRSVAQANAEEAARMRKALEFYADPASWANVTQWDQRKIEVGGFTLDAVVIHSPAMDDDGKTARAALRIDSALAEGGKP